MQNLFRHYATLARRWAWLVVLGMALCGGTSFVVSTLLHPTYQASATLVISMKSADSAVDNVSASELAALTYAQLLTNSTILEPVAAQHPGMTLQQLDAMVSVNARSNTQLIELDVKNEDARVATQLANEIAQNFENFSQTQLPVNVQVVPAQLPTSPISPRRLSNTIIGIFVGLGLALTLIVIFEWIDDLPRSSEEIEDLLGMEVVAAFPQASRHQQLQVKELEAIPTLAEECQLLCAFLIAKQATIPLKLVMVTSASSGEGKSTVAALLASILAKSGKNVLLADSTTYTLTAGEPAANPDGVQQSPTADRPLEQAKEAPFDYVIFDTPPLLPVADAQLLALHMQAILLVVDGSKTPRRALARTRNVLERTPVAIRGVVINKNRGNHL